MPVITIDGPVLNKKQKADLVKSFSETISEVTKLPLETVVVLVREYEADNVGRGNSLLSDLD